jgi:hypothetical protein
VIPLFVAALPLTIRFFLKGGIWKKLEKLKVFRNGGQLKKN